MLSRAELADDFRRIGIQAGDTVMLHASVRAVGPIAGGPDQIHLALKDALTDHGTLLMYASCAEGYDDVGRGHLSADDERELLEKQPAFDPLTVRAARDNGALVEFFRTYPGSRVNAHVTRFVAWGARSDYLFSEQPWDFALGRGSALERLAHVNGKIVLLGSDHDTVTFLHYAEHIVDIPNKRIARFKVPILENGVRVWREMQEVDSSARGAHESWPPRFFARIVDAYLSNTRNRGGRVGGAETYVIESGDLLAFAVQQMRSVAGVE